MLATLALAAALGCAATPPAPAPAAPALPTSATANGTSIVAIAPPGQQCCPKQTLPEFLGLTHVLETVGGCLTNIRNRLGAIWPGLEAKPPVLAITDPANLQSDNPAVAEAAAVKAEEDAAAQKAKAIEYLASIGCAGCYPGIEDALLAALDDCTEEVRFAAANGLRASAAEPCKNCRTSACCGPKIREKLEKMAYDQDANGCYVEPSDRVRRVARLALCNCMTVSPKPGQQQTRPQEGPDAPEGPPIAAESPTVAGAPAGERSVLARPAASAAPIGSGVSATNSTSTSSSKPATAATPAAPVAIQAAAQPTPQVNRPVSYEEVLTAYQLRGTPRGESLEATWEEWLLRVDQYPSRQDAIAAMTIARTQAMSAGGQVALPEIQKTTHDWTATERISSPALARMVHATPVGGVSGVIEDRGGLRMIRVLGIRPAMPTPAAPVATSPGPSPTVAARRAAVSGPSSAIVRLPPCDCDR
jgi:hypothetical protein